MWNILLNITSFYGKQIWCTVTSEDLAEMIENLTVKRIKTTRDCVTDTSSLGFVVLVF